MVLLFLTSIILELIQPLLPLISIDGEWGVDSVEKQLKIIYDINSTKDFLKYGVDSLRMKSMPQYLEFLLRFVGNEKN